MKKVPTLVLSLEEFEKVPPDKMLAYYHTESWLTQASKAYLVTLNEGTICQIVKQFIPWLSDDIYQSPHYYIFSWHTLWIIIWVITCSMSVFPIHRKFQEGRDFFYHVFPEFSSVAPTRCSVIIYWVHECHYSPEEHWSELLTVVHGEWHALAFWRLRGHWDKCSFSFSLPSLSKSPNNIISKPFKQDQSEAFYLL